MFLEKISIKTKIISLFVILTVLGISVMSVFGAIITTDSFYKYSWQKLDGIGSAKEKLIELYISEQRDTLDILGDSMMDHIANNDTEDEVLGDTADDIQKIDKYAEKFDEIFTVNSQGVIVFSTDSNQEGKIVSGETYFKEGLSRDFLDTPKYYIAYQKPTMVVSMPVKNPGNNTVYVLAGRINFRQINEIMTERTGLGETGETLLINSFNYAMTDLKEEDNAAFKKTIYTDAVKSCLQHHDGYTEFNDYSGTPVLGNYRWMDNFDMCLVVKVDKTEITAPVSLLLETTVAVALITSIVVMVIGVIFAKTITKPIDELTKCAKSIQHGNLDAECKIKTNDEFSILGKSFDEMRCGIKDRNDLLNTILRTFKGKFGNIVTILLRKDVEELTKKNPRILSILPKVIRTSLRKSRQKGR
jgi:HAMP domain-containing protein